MKLEILRVEVLEAEDEVAQCKVDVTEVIMKSAQIKPGGTIGMAMAEQGVMEVGLRVLIVWKTWSLCKRMNIRKFL